MAAGDLSQERQVHSLDIAGSRWDSQESGIDHQTQTITTWRKRTSPAARLTVRTGDGGDRLQRLAEDEKPFAEWRATRVHLRADATAIANSASLHETDLRCGLHVAFLRSHRSWTAPTEVGGSLHQVSVQPSENRSQQLIIHSLDLLHHRLSQWDQSERAGRCLVLGRWRAEKCLSTLHSTGSTCARHSLDENSQRSRRIHHREGSRRLLCHLLVGLRRRWVSSSRCLRLGIIVGSLKWLRVNTSLNSMPRSEGRSFRTWSISTEKRGKARASPSKLTIPTSWVNTISLSRKEKWMPIASPPRNRSSSSTSTDKCSTTRESSMNCLSSWRDWLPNWRFPLSRKKCSSTIRSWVRTRGRTSLSRRLSVEAKVRCSSFNDIRNELQQFDNATSYQLSEESMATKAELKLFSRVYLMVGIHIQAYPDNFPFEISARLLDLFGSKPHITRLIKQFDEHSIQHGGLVVPYGQLQAPGTGLLFSMHLHTAAVVDVDFADGQTTAISLSNRIVVIDMKEARIMLNINLPVLDEPYLNCTTLSRALTVDGKGEVVSTSSSAGDQQRFKRFLFLVNSLHHAYLITGQEHIRFERASKAGFRTIEIIDETRGLCVLGEIDGHSVECWNIVANRLFDRIDFPTSPIKNVLCISASRLIVTLLHDGSIHFHSIPDHSSSSFFHCGSTKADAHLNSIFSVGRFLVCTFDTVTPVDFALIDLTPFVESKTFLGDKEVLKTLVHFDPPVTAVRPIKSIVAPYEKEMKTKKKEQEFPFFAALTSDSLFLVHQCQNKKVSYLQINGQYDLVYLDASHPNTLYTARGCLIDIYNWTCQNLINPSDGNLQCLHEYQLYVSIDVHSAPVTTITPSSVSRERSVWPSSTPHSEGFFFVRVHLSLFTGQRNDASVQFEASASSVWKDASVSSDQSNDSKPWVAQSHSSHSRYFTAVHWTVFWFSSSLSFSENLLLGRIAILPALNRHASVKMHWRSGSSPWPRARRTPSRSSFFSWPAIITFRCIPVNHSAKNLCSRIIFVLRRGFIRHRTALFFCWPTKDLFIPSLNTFPRIIQRPFITRFISNWPFHVRRCSVRWLRSTRRKSWSSLPTMDDLWLLGRWKVWFTSMFLRWHRPWNLSREDEGIPMPYFCISMINPWCRVEWR